MKRVICLLLIACFMVAALASCGGGTGNTPNETTPSTQTPTGTDTQAPSASDTTPGATDPVTNPVTDPSTDPVTNPVTDPTDDPVVTDPTDDPVVTDPTDDPVVTDPTDDPVVTDPTTQAPETNVTGGPTGPIETNEYNEQTFTSPNNYDEVDLEGEALNIVVRNQLSVQREWYKDTPEDEVDEVIAMRNESVASIVNVEVNYTLLGSSNYEECLSAFNAAIMEDVDNDQIGRAHV